MTRYADPVARGPIGRLPATDRPSDWKASLEARRGNVVCVGFQTWKRPVARSFFGGTGNEVLFASARRAPELARKLDARIFVWGSSAARALRASRHRDLQVWQVEDGFIRSVGLGSDLNTPASFAIDPVGIYYDATRPSRLEEILQTVDFDEATLARARRLREVLRRRKVSKYNVGGAQVELPPEAAGRRTVLVVGQVPNDASLALGKACFGGDKLAFLAAVRRSEPDAFLIFKEHPDLVRRNRPGWLSARQVLRHADMFLRTGDTAHILDRIDHLHTMTSLSGFEALIHGLPVTCWGVPFYAGWGLTEDKVVCTRRMRMRNIDELVAAALLEYPHYVDPVSGIPCTAEDIIEGIFREQGTDPQVRAARWRITLPLRALFRARIRLLAHLEHPIVLYRRRRDAVRNFAELTKAEPPNA